MVLEGVDDCKNGSVNYIANEKDKFFLNHQFNLKKLYSA